MTDAQLSRAQEQMFDKAVIASGARRPDSLAPDGAVCARLDWFGLHHLQARLSADGTTLSFGITLVSGAFHPLRSEALGNGWDGSTLEGLLNDAKSHVEKLVPPAYVEWFTRERGKAATRESFAVEQAYLRPARSSDLHSVIAAAREVYGNALVLDAVGSTDFRVRATVYESFELEITTDGFQHTMRCVAGVRSESGASHTVPFQHLYEGSWSPQEIVAQLTDIRTWCIKVLPEDFLTELELACGPLPGVSEDG